MDSNNFDQKIGVG